MARYIDVEPFINWLESEINYFGEPNISIRPVAFGTKNALQSVLGFVNSQPTADVVEVVRCKECGSYNKNYGECTLNGSHFGENGYCCKGTRKLR